MHNALRVFRCASVYMCMCVCACVVCLCSVFVLCVHYTHITHTYKCREKVWPTLGLWKYFVVDTKSTVDSLRAKLTADNSMSFPDSPSVFAQGRSVTEVVQWLNKNGMCYVCICCVCAGTCVAVFVWYVCLCAYVCCVWCVLLCFSDV